MTTWESLTDAYGPAGAVPEILAAADLSGTQFGDAWDDAWSHLCHQGTVYPASYASLPILREIAERRSPAGYLAAVGLAAGIVAATNGPRDRTEARAEYQSDIDALREIAETSLGSASSETEFIYGLEALMAFEDGGVWQRALSHLADEEVPLTCPHCSEFLVLDPTDSAGVSASTGRGASTEVSRRDLVDGSVEQRIVSVAQAHQQNVVERQLRFLFGRSTCPVCRIGFDVPAGVRAYYA